ncbi:acyl-CoA dehydrogenase family protein [Ectobacillus sp. sgz5001026]|uniref:acyl-CoA dehydrogenase family protein n=1 Tax=Ectobacillus sp. sgz5001026 TaxID=3242473 RepID=UPI0036D2A4A9
MDLFVTTETQHRIIQQIEQLLPKFAEREYTLDELGSFPFQNIEDLKHIGYTMQTVPTEFGGGGISLYDFLLFQEKIAEGDGATALSIGWHMAIVLELAETRAWDKKIFSWMCENINKGALLNRAASERATGSPARGGKPTTTAYKQDDAWIINGRKTFTSMSPVLDYFIVTATIADTDEVGGFLIPRGTSGFSIEETWDSVAMRGTASHDIVLDEVKVPLAYLVEIKGKSKVNGSLLHIPACYLGIAKAAFDYAVTFAKTHQNNSIPEPIATLPNVTRLIGEMEVELMQARHFMYSVAQQYDRGYRQEIKGELAAVKYVATNAAIVVVDKAMRIVGARSLSAKNPLHRYYLNVRAGLHNPPMDDITISLLAKLATEE